MQAVPGTKKGQTQGLNLLWTQPTDAPEANCLLKWCKGVQRALASMRLSLLWVQSKVSSDKWPGSPQGQGVPRGRSDPVCQGWGLLARGESGAGSAE